MVSHRIGRQAAPGDLERVRALLNSWLIPNDTRVPSDDFDAYARELHLGRADARVMRSLRDDLRALVEGAPGAAERIDDWIEHLRIRPAVRAGRLSFRHQGRQAGDTLAIALAAMTDGRWARLKACPDCHWVFYDHTRNGSKRWCLMNAGGPQGRACGTIAKVRRYRERNRASGAAPVKNPPSRSDRAGS